MKLLQIIGFCAWALMAMPSPAIAASQEVVHVKVNGLVCDFCARALEKVFGKRDEVKMIAVDLDNAHVAITMNPEQSIDDATLTKLITDSGYNVVAIDRGGSDE